MNDKTNVLKVIAWVLSILNIGLALAVWVEGLNGRYDDISSYQLFPLFGLVAFSLMWGHYIMSALRQILGVDRDALASYFRVTSWLVLIAILLHPGLLIWQLWRDGFGLPPASYLENYVAPALRGAATLGSVSFLAFLAYEFHRKFSEKTWWKWVQYASDTAMLAILYHSFKLGSHVQQGWFRGVWVFYGVTFIGALAYLYALRFRRPKVV